ncbi:unnamed protein product [Vicia faba]|uniref:Uncharacterized protein n=1 Tax=Vicia faba TaxID=3906 RepID=A0AAV1B1R3_VICFA|nr:unnamed protein product [Vicia faba]
MAEMFSRLPPPFWGSEPLTIWSTDHTEGQALKRRTGTSGINVFQFLALHRPSNGPWTKWPLPERTMSRGPPPPPQGNTLTLGTGAWPKSRVAQSSIKEIPVLCPIH